MERNSHAFDTDEAGDKTHIYRTPQNSGKRGALSFYNFNAVHLIRDTRYSASGNGEIFADYTAFANRSHVLETLVW